MTPLKRFQNLPSDVKRYLALAFVFSACSLSWELLVVKTLNSIVGWTVITHSMTLAIFLLSLGAGTWLSQHARDKQLERRLFKIEISMVFVGILLVPALFLIYELIKSKFYLPHFPATPDSTRLRACYLALGQVFTAILGLLSGFELPLLIQLVARQIPEDAVRWTLSMNYAGALAGNLVFSLLITPRLDAITAACLIALINWGAACFLLRPSIPKARLWTTGSVAAFAIFALVYGQAPLLDHHLKMLYTVKPGVEPTSVRRLNTPYQVIDLVETNGTTFVMLDGNLQLGHHLTRSYHEFMIHAPVQFYEKVPEKVLILGGGDGGLAGEILKYGNPVTQVTIVELDSRMIELAKTTEYFKSVNHDAFSSPKTRIIIADALTWLRGQRNHGEKYDAIFLDFPLPFDSDVLKLYSREFYTLARQLLSVNGFMVLDTGMSDDAPAPWNKVLLDTLVSAGFESPLTFGRSGGDVFVTASRNSRNPNLKWKDYGLALTVFNAAELRESLKQIPVASGPGRQVNSLFRPSLNYLPYYHF